jgi:hypothetical protein
VSIPLSYDTFSIFYPTKKAATTAAIKFFVLGFVLFTSRAGTRNTANLQKEGATNQGC